MNVCTSFAHGYRDQLQCFDNYGVLFLFCVCDPLQYDPGTQFFDTSSKQRAPAYTDRILFKTKSPPTGVRRGSNLAMLLSGSIGSNNTNTVGGGQHHSVQTLECMAYDSVPSIVTSDHKPVWALFRCSVRPGSDA